VPSIGDLYGVGRAVPSAIGVAAGPVSADHLHAGMQTEPTGEVVGFPAQEHVDRAMLVGQVDQHRAVLVAAAQCELIDAQDRHRADRWIGQGADHPQQRRPAHTHPQLGGQS
jgi:hypothetical protein